MTDIGSPLEVHEAILATACDYYEGWFDGDRARMERALHPDLVKRSVEGDELIETITASEMVSWAAEGVGRRTDTSERSVALSVDHVHGGIATVHAVGAVYVDYLQLVLVAERWQILNVLWARA